MINVHFSIRKNGACPICAKFDSCSIVKIMVVKLNDRVKPLHDDTMEVVIYRCPEFEER